MRVFVAGGAGAVGRQLVPMLLADGHQVTATTRSDARAAWLRDAGADAVIVDVYDVESLRAAVGDARPDVVIHQLTDLAGGFEPDDLRANARLRVLGTRNLVDACLGARVRRLVAQSGAWLYAPGPTPHTEADPLGDPANRAENLVLPGVIELERLVLGTPGIDGIVLRYGFLYGPATASETAGEDPTVHVIAAARAAALAVQRGPAGIYNIVDDGGSVSNGRARTLLGWSPGVAAGER